MGNKGIQGIGPRALARLVGRKVHAGFVFTLGTQSIGTYNNISTSKQANTRKNTHVKENIYLNY